MRLKEFFGLNNQNQEKKKKKKPLTSEAMKGTNLLDDMTSLSIIEMCEGAGGGGGGGGDGEEIQEEEAHIRKNAAEAEKTDAKANAESAAEEKKQESMATAMEEAIGWAKMKICTEIKASQAQETRRASGADRRAASQLDRVVRTAGRQSAKESDKADRIMEREVQSERRGIAKDQRDELRDELRTEHKENPPSTPPTSAPSAPSDTGDEISLPHLPQGKHTLPPGLSAVAAVQQVQRGKGRNPMNSKKSEKPSEKEKAPQHQKTSDKKAEQTVGGNNMHQIGKNQSKNQTIGKGQLVRRSQIIHTDKDKSY